MGNDQKGLLACIVDQFLTHYHLSTKPRSLTREFLCHDNGCSPNCQVERCGQLWQNLEHVP